MTDLFIRLISTVEYNANIGSVMKIFVEILNGHCKGNTFL